MLSYSYFNKNENLVLGISIGYKMHVFDFLMKVGLL